MLLDEPKQGEPLYLREQQFLMEYADDVRSQHNRASRVGFQESSPIDNWRRLIACIIPPGHYCVHKIRYFAPNAKYDLYALISVFNSETTEWRFNLTSTNNSINAYEVDALPIPCFARLKAMPDQRPVVDWKRWETVLGRAETGVVAWEQAVDAEMKATPAEVDAWPDTIHDALATAGKEMSQLGEERQRLTNGFAAWLVDTLKIDEEAFSGMTYLRGSGQFRSDGLASVPGLASQEPEGMWAGIVAE